MELKAALDLCCTKLKKNKEKFIISENRGACCFLEPIRYEIDIVANNLVPIYGLKNNFLNSSLSRLINLSGEKSDKTELDLNYSELNFPKEIWNVRENWEISVKTLAVVPLVLIAIFGNLAVIRIILKKEALRKNPVNLFILNMSIADLLTALLFPWIFLISDFYQCFVLGSFICKYEGFTLITLMLSSVLSLTVLSFDRLIAVVFPLKVRMTPKRARWVIYAIWIISISVSTPLIVWRSYKKRQWKDFNETWCTENIKALKDYWLVLVVLLVWLPLFILSMCYTGIFFTLDALEKRQREKSSSHYKSKSKVIRMLFMVVLVFSICWIPFTALIFIRNYNTNSSTSTVEVKQWYKVLFFISHYLMFVNSAVNPIIYGLKNENFRREFRRYGLPAFLKKSKSAEVSGDIGKKERTNKTTFEKQTKKHKIFVSKSSGVPNLSYFERRNSAFKDIGLPTINKSQMKKKRY